MNRTKVLAVIGALAVLVLLSGVGLNLVTAQSPSRSVSAPGDVAAALPQAKPGQCYAKVMTPAAYKTVTEEVVTREAAQKFQIVPAKYEWKTEKVLVQEAASKLVEVPAVFETVTEKVVTAPARRIWRTGPNSKYRTADASLVAAAKSLGIPATAAPGQCFAEYVQPVKFRTENVKVVTQQASDRLEIVPAKYKWVDEKVLVKPASNKIVETAAAYETVTEKVLDTPAYTTWKAGRGPVERLDNSTGEIMCLVEVPAKYKTVTKRKLKSAATTKKVEISAEYKTVRKQKLVSAATVKKIPVPAKEKTVTKKILVSDEKISWHAAGQSGSGTASGRKLCMAEIAATHQMVATKKLKTAATTKKVEIPAKYTDMRVLKLASPATEKSVPIPAQRQKITKQVKVADGRLEWRQVLCETNISRDLVTQLQRALKSAGLEPGPIDGVLGAQTMAAISSYQQKQGLARGGLTMATVEKLGIRLGS